MNSEQTFQVKNNYIYPLDFVYENPKQPLPNTGGKLFQLEKVEYPEWEGMSLFMTGGAYPMKGFPLPPIDLGWVDQVKRFLVFTLKMVSTWQFLLSFLLTWNKRKFIERWMSDYTEVADRCLKHLYIKEEYLTSVATEIKICLVKFLSELKINNGLSEKLARVIAHLIEYDDAYRLRVQDIMSETSESNLKKPQKEIRRLLLIAHNREHQDKNVYKKFETIAKILLVVLWIPKVKKAYNKTIDYMILRNLQYTEADRYWASPRSDYDFFGMTKEQRSVLYKDKPSEFDAA